MKNTVFAILALAAVAVSAGLVLDTGAEAVEGQGGLLGQVVFDHQMHTYIADKCSACHHQHEGVSTTQCGGCHSFGAADLKKDVSKNFLACRHCHGVYNPEQPGMPGLKVAYHKQCFTCHLGMKGLGEGGRSGCTAQCHAKTTTTNETNTQEVKLCQTNP